MIYYISGGVKNGKSTFAQKIVCAMPGPHYYLATMRPKDREDLARIARHRADRADLGFLTVEQPEHICGALERCDPGGAFLLDSVTALLENEMFRSDGTVSRAAAAQVEAELLRFATSVKNVVFVSDYLFSDGAAFDELTETYCAGLGRIGCTLAGIADGTAELCAALPLWYRGGWTE